jgi:hypothetical protein
VPLLVYAAWKAFSGGKDDVLALLCGITLATFTMFHFRGSHHWPGFLGWEWGPKAYSYVPVWAPIPVGALLAKVMKNSWKSWDAIAFVSVVVVALLWSAIDANRDIGMYHLSPYTRHLALLATVVCIGVTGAVWSVLGRFSE